jgi:hypothetical protein
VSLRQLQLSFMAVGRERVEPRILVQPPVVNKVYVVGHRRNAISVEPNESFATAPAPRLLTTTGFPYLHSPGSG